MIDIRIMASPKRADYVKELVNKLGLSEDIVVWDDRPNGGDAMYTARKAWLYPLPEGCTHRLVLQDDIDVCEDFIKHATAIADRHPTHVVSLICFNEPTNYPNKKNTPYYKIKDNMSGCAIMLPVDIIKPCMEWCEESNDEILKPHDDLMISKYCRDNNILMVTIIPSIVQHLGGYESLLNIEYGWNRKSKHYNPNPEVDWSVHSVQKIK